jgi:hypothetical protein
MRTSGPQLGMCRKSVVYAAALIGFICCVVCHNEEATDWQRGSDDGVAALELSLCGSCAFMPKSASECGARNGSLAWTGGITISRGFLVTSGCNMCHTVGGVSLCRKQDMKRTDHFEAQKPRFEACSTSVLLFACSSRKDSNIDAVRHQDSPSTATTPGCRSHLAGDAQSVDNVREDKSTLGLPVMPSRAQNVDNVREDKSLLGHQMVFSRRHK